jgi:outer membrane autotransporter protein
VAKARKRREVEASVARRLQPALARARHFALLSSTAIILAGLISAPLRANDECGPAPSLEGGIDATLDGSRGQRYSFGAFAGSGTSRQNFDGSASEANSDLLRAGLYGSYLRGAYYGDAIAKFDRQSAEYRGLSTGDEDAPFTVDLLGLSLETGYRFTLQRAYVQPRLRLAYAHAWAGDFEDASGAGIDLGDADSLAASIAARLGARLGAADVHADFGLSHEILGQTQADVSGLSFTGELPGTAGQIAAGASLPLLQDKLVWSVDAGYALGPDGEEFTATTALRVAY